MARAAVGLVVTALLLLGRPVVLAAPPAEDPVARAAVEKYFSATDSDGRATAVRALEGVDVGVVAGLVGTRQEWTGMTPGVYYVNEEYEGKPVRYFLGVPPGYVAEQAVPLVVMLPSPTPFVSLPVPDAAKVEGIYTQWIAGELAKHPDAAVMMPLVNLDELYGPGPEGVFSVMGALRHAMGKMHVDAARVYLFGHAAGAHATWNLGFGFPTYFAAIAPLAGQASGDWQKLRQLNLRNLGVVMWQDLDDPLVPVNPTRELMASLKRLKIDVDYLQTRGMGHTPTAVVAEDRYAAMRKRVKELYPKHVTVQTDRPDPEYCRVEWLEITDVLNPMGERRLIPKHGSGFLTVFTNPAKADATIDAGKNEIAIVTTNTAELRLHLSSALVDLGRVVTVNVNRRVRYSAVPVQSVGALLEDARVLGRGWRDYPVTIDLDLTKPPATMPATRGATTEPTK